MPRTARRKSSTNVYHVVIRGIDHQLLFLSPKDNVKYLNILQDTKERFQFEIYAYCLMSNHIHLLINTFETPIDQIFRCCNTSYSTWFNLKYQRCGRLLQGRFYSEPIETKQALLCAARYIHRNPINAGLETQVGESYKWNSFHSYKADDRSLINIDFINDIARSADYFTDFCQLKNDDIFLDANDLKRRIPDDVALQIILETTKCSSAIDLQNMSIRDKRKYLIQLHDKGLSIRQLNRLTGIPKTSVEKYLKRHF